MQKLFYAWLSLRNGGCIDNSQHWRDKVRNTFKTVWSRLPQSGQWCLVLAAILCILSIVEMLLPAHSRYMSYVEFATLFFLCVASFYFLRFTHKTMLTKMETGEYDQHAENVAKLLMDNDIFSLQDFDAVMAWCDELINKKEVRLTRFTRGTTIILTFCLNVFTDVVSDLPAFEALQPTIVVALLVFGIVVADVSAAFFHIIDSVMPTSLTALQDFKGDLLESKLQFMELVQRRDKTEPVRRF